MKYLLFFLGLAFVVGLRGADRPTAKAWPFVVLAFMLGFAFLSYSVI